jgi:drug/metabolite transporter (DMT)-like permease
MSSTLTPTLSQRERGDKNMWLFFALFSRFLWSGGSAIDQVLSRAHQHHRTRSVLTLCYCAYLPFSLVAYCLSDDIHVPPVFFGWLALGLAAHMLALLPYYKGMQREQAYNIVPYMELTPVFLTVLALTLRGEYLTPLQMAAGGAVILCGFAFSWDFAHGRFKKKLLLLMSLASFLFAIMQFSIKSASEIADVWTVTFYFTLCQSCIGFFMLAVFGKVRRSIVSACKATAGKTVLLALSGTSLSFLAFASLTYAFKTAPTTGHVAALSGTQPFFSFLLAFPLAHIIPKHYEPVIRGREMKLKMLLLFGILIGIYVLVMNGGT